MICGIALCHMALSPQTVCVTHSLGCEPWSKLLVGALGSIQKHYTGRFRYVISEKLITCDRWNYDFTSSAVQKAVTGLWWCLFESAASLIESLKDPTTLWR